MSLPTLPADKANHVIYGACLFAAAGAIAGHFGLPHSRLIGVGVALAVGVAKEITDYLANRAAIARGEPPPHGVELADVIATVGGALLAAAAGEVPHG